MEVTVKRIGTEIVPTETQGRDPNKQYAYMGIDSDGRDVYRELSDSEVQQLEIDKGIAISRWRTMLPIKVKAEANRRILAILPDWKQRNYTARAVEKVAAGEIGDDEWSIMQTAWQKIKAVRVASDAIEAEVVALTDDQAEQYDVANNPLWP